MKDRVSKSIFWIVWSRAGLQTISFLNTLLVARLLSPNDYGLMAIATLWTNVMSMLAELGLGAAIIQFRDIKDEELNACFWVTFGLAMLGFFSLYAVSPFISAWLDIPRLSGVLRILGFLLPLLALRTVPDSLLRKGLANDKISQAEILSTIVTIPIVLVMAWSSMGVWALVAGALAQPLTYGIAVFWFVQWRPGLRIGGGRLREVFRFSAAILGSRICWTLYQQADIVILGKRGGEVVLGFYSMAKEFALLPVTKISGVLNQLMPSIMAELQSDPAAIRASLLRAIRLVGCISIPSSIGMLLVADDLVRVSLSEKWMEAVPLLKVLTLYAMIRSLDVFFPPILSARYRAAYLFCYTAALMVLMPLAFWVGATWLGGLGVAVAWVLAYPIVMFHMARETSKEIGIQWGAIWEELRIIVIATLFMTVVVLAVQWGLSHLKEETSFVRLIISSGVGAVTYALVILRWGSRIMKDVVEVAGWVLRPTLAAASEE